MEEIPFNKSKFSELARTYEKQTAKVPVPELNEVMGVEPGQIVVFEVIQADLATQLWAREESRNKLEDLGEIIVSFLRGDNGSEEITKAIKNEKLSTDAEFQIRLCEKCIIDPEKLLRSELIWLAQHFPTVVSRLAAKIMELSNAGSVKKI